MRLFRALAVAMLVTGLMGASPVLAEESAGWVSGHALDAVGRPLANRSVELLGALQGQPVGAPLQAVLTDAAGAWSFTAVPAGDYVVQVVDRGRTAGVPVEVTEATGAPGVLIVAPSAPAPAVSVVQPGAGGSAAVGGFDWLALGIGAFTGASSAALVVVARDES